MLRQTRLGLFGNPTAGEREITRQLKAARAALLAQMRAKFPALKAATFEAAWAQTEPQVRAALERKAFKAMEAAAIKEAGPEAACPVPPWHVHKNIAEMLRRWTLHYFGEGSKARPTFSEKGGGYTDPAYIAMLITEEPKTPMLRVARCVKVRLPYTTTSAQMRRYAEGKGLTHDRSVLRLRGVLFDFDAVAGIVRALRGEYSRLEMHVGLAPGETAQPVMLFVPVEGDVATVLLAPIVTDSTVVAYNLEKDRIEAVAPGDLHLATVGEESPAAEPLPEEVRLRAGAIGELPPAPPRPPARPTRPRRPKAPPSAVPAAPEAPPPATPPVEAAKAAAEAEPWQITRHAYSVSYPATYAGGVPIGKVDIRKQDEHEAAVKAALERGDPVPANVLVDYPYLVKKAAEDEPELPVDPPDDDLAAAVLPPPQIDGGSPPAPTVVPFNRDDVLHLIETTRGQATLLNLKASFVPEDAPESFMTALTNALAELVEAGALLKVGATTYKIAEPQETERDAFVQDNRLALEIVEKGPGSMANHDLVNRLYTGLGGVVENKRGLFGLNEKRQGNLQQHYTVKEVADFMVALLAIPARASVLDPTCGHGRLLYSCPNHRLVHGVEVENDAYTIAKWQFPDGMIVQDSIAHHMWDNTFDYIVTNPPFTLTWQDIRNLYKKCRTKTNNRIISHYAILELCVRAIKPGGFIAAILPSKTFTHHLTDSHDFMDWFWSQMSALAEIDLPGTTHKTSEWGVKLFIFQKYEGAGRSWDSEAVWRQPLSDEAVFRETAQSLEDLPAILEKWRASTYWDYVQKYADKRDTRKQVKIEPVNMAEFKKATLRGVSTAITSDEIVDVDVQPGVKVDSWQPDTLALTPNGLPASLEVADMQAKWAPTYSERAGAYIDTFKREILQASGVSAGWFGFDDLEIVRMLRGHDVTVRPTDAFVGFLERKQAWVEFQNVPFAQQVDPEQTDTWITLNGDKDYDMAYPKEWTDMIARFDAAAQKNSWFTGLKHYQKKDALRLAMKNAAIYAAMMGMGKSRTAVAVGILKGARTKMIVCPAKLIENWGNEFEGLGMDRPYRITAKDDVKRIGEHDWCIISVDTLKMKWEAVKARADTAENPPTDLYDDAALQDFFDQEGDWLLGSDWDVDGEPVENPAKKDPEKASETQEEAVAKIDKPDRFGDHLAGKFDFLVVDECHLLSNPDTARSSGVRKLRAHSHLFLTGTPIANRVRGLYSILMIGWGRKTAGNPMTAGEFYHTFQRLMTGEERAALREETFKKFFADNPEALLDFLSSFEESAGYDTRRKRSRSSGRTFEVPGINNPEKLVGIMESKWLRRVKFEREVADQIQFVRPKIVVHNPTMNPEHKKFYDNWFQDTSEVVKAALFTGSGRKEEAEDEDAEEEKEKVGSPIMWAILRLRQAAIVPHFKELHHHAGEPIIELENHPLHPSYERDAFYEGTTARQTEILDLIESEAKEGRRCFLISYFEETIRTFERELAKRKFEPLVIIGSVPMKKRMALIDRYKERAPQAVLIGSYGTFDVGLNLPEADTCIVVEPDWNWSTMEQAWSRMLRITSRGDKTVHVFIQKGTIEDYMWRLASIKRFNVSKVLDHTAVGEEPDMIGMFDMIRLMLYDAEHGIDRSAGEVGEIEAGERAKPDEDEGVGA